jgi:hypothetical protein
MSPLAQYFASMLRADRIKIVWRDRSGLCLKLFVWLTYSFPNFY